MSSTNRSNARDSHIADYYVTPVEDISIFLKELNNIIPLESDLVVVDPASGGGTTDEMSYPVALSKYGITTETYDIRQDSRAEHICNYLEEKLDYKPDMIITNPPFNQAMEFITKAIDDVKDDGYVVMLLRLNFLETKARKQFFDKYMPKYIFVHHKRMSFVKGKGTDSVAYAHFVWHKNNYPEFANIKVI